MLDLCFFAQYDYFYIVNPFKSNSFRFVPLDYFYKCYRKWYIYDHDSLECEVWLDCVRIYIDGRLAGIGLSYGLPYLSLPF